MSEQKHNIGDTAGEKTLKTARAAGRRITVIGGGTGLSTLLLGLKEYTENITAIVTVTDDGGGSGILRQEFNMLPPGDIRNCILALANTTPSMSKVLNYRFTEGSLTGQSFGNLFLLALNGVYGSFEDAVAKMNEILAVTGRVLPVTNANIKLTALFDDGEHIVGETSITEHKTITGKRINRIGILPSTAHALPQVIEAIKEADVLVFGPGSLYTSIIPNLLVGGVREAINASDATKIYVLNIMTQEGETENYSAKKHLSEVERYIGEGNIDICLANNEPISHKLMQKYGVVGAEPIMVKKGEFDDKKLCVYEGKMLSRGANLARHDPLRLANHIMQVLAEYAPRESILRIYDEIILKRN